MLTTHPVSFVLAVGLAVTITDSALVQLPEAAVVSIAESWLQEVDAGHFDQSWETAGSSFKEQVTKREWIETLRVKRGDLGAFQSRQATSTRALRGTGGREYQRIDFTAAFARRTAREAVTLLRDVDGGWRVVGYVVQ